MMRRLKLWSVYNGEETVFSDVTVSGADLAATVEAAIPLAPFDRLYLSRYDDQGRRTGHQQPRGQVGIRARG